MSKTTRESINSLLSAMSGNGQCVDCGAPTPAIRHDGYRTVWCVRCTKCVARRRDTSDNRLRRERLTAWMVNSLIPQEQVDEAIMHGARVHRGLEALGVTGREAWSAWLYGPTGTGKTANALLWAHEKAAEALREDAAGHMPMTRYMTEERALTLLGHRDFMPVYGELCRAKVLILDDVGAVGGNERERQRLTDVLVERMARRMTTIFISNFFMGDLYSRHTTDRPMWDARLFERVLRATADGLFCLEFDTPYRNIHARESATRVEAMFANIKRGGAQ